MLPEGPASPESLRGPEGDAREPRAGFALLLLCFFLSGVAALVYQTAWTRQFAFVFGTSELAVASVLAAYMGGLALGAAAASRLAGRLRSPVRVYAVLELAIGLSALAVPLGVAAATRLYVAIFGGQGAPADEGGLLTALFYLACAFAILLVPTSLMGATLPLLARHAVRREEEIGRRVGLLYAINTAGAVVGTLATGFVLLPSLGLRTTVWIAIAANFAVFAAAAALARTSAPLAPDAQRAAPAGEAREGNRWILPLIGLSGAISFTYEVLWTRLLGHVLGGSVYAFATMLATFLAGIALGSWLASGRAVDDRARAARGFAWAQVGIGALALAAYLAIDETPVWVAGMALVGDARLLLDAAVCAAILLPSTLCVGATFPLAVRVLARGREDAGPASARVYAWNTVGAIVGAVGAGFFLIPAVGFEWTLAAAVTCNAALAAVTALRVRPRLRAALATAAALLVLLVALRPGPPWKLLRMGAIAGAVIPGRIVYYGVGRSATVTVREIAEGWQLSSNALAEAMISPPGVREDRFRIARWLSNLPAWGNPGARRMLIVGFGGGLGVEAVPESFDAIHVVEIEPEILRANRAIAGQRARDPLSDPRLEVIVNDARGALLLTRERYDAIVSQPSHPWTSGSSHLYTREFFALARDHLTDRGVFVQWMGINFIDEALLRSLVATLLDVYPHVRIYRPALGGLVFTASPTPFAPEGTPDAFLAGSAGAALGVHGPEDVVAHMLLDDEASRAFARGAPLVTDDRNLLQMRSPALVRDKRQLDVDAATGDHDPLARGELPWDRRYLVRRMLASGLEARAERVAAAAADPGERDVGLALVALAQGREAEALRRLRQALERDPHDLEARAALLRQVRSGPAGDALLERFGLEPTPAEALVVRGWQREAGREWPALRALDDDLARVPVRHPVYPDAARLRVAWRVAQGSPERAREALALLDDALPLGMTPADLLTRGTAAALAGEPVGAAACFSEFLQKVEVRRGNEKLLRRALATLERLPEGSLAPGQQAFLADALRARLRIASRTR